MLKYLIKGVINLYNNQITEVSSERSLFSVNFKELWKYRDLIFLFVKRDFKNSYKQTILGPVWIVLNPFLSTFVFTIIFGIIANISTDGVPQFLFYMSGNILWGFFASCLNRASATFLGNARIFSKVYFPRLSMPIAGIIYNSVSFFIQFSAFLILAIIYMCLGSGVQINLCALLLPLLLIITALLATGCGLIISSITTKYRDLTVLVSFGVSLWMYITPVVYPVSQISADYRWIALLNPVAPIVETFRYAFLGSGIFPWQYLVLSAVITAIVLAIGIVVFNQVEKNFIDTV